jgi:hypothetical protein
MSIETQVIEKWRAVALYRILNSELGEKIDPTIRTALFKCAESWRHLESAAEKLHYIADVEGYGKLLMDCNTPELAQDFVGKFGKLVPQMRFEEDEPQHSIENPEIPYDKQIDSIMERFDFIHVKNTMKAIGWEWAAEGGNAVPTISRLQITARKLLREVVNAQSCPGTHSRGMSVMTGGLEANINPTGELSLAFVIEKQYCDPNVE